MSTPKKLYRSDTDKQLAGVCGGLAEYLNIDPTVIRVGYIFLTAISGFIPGMLAYVVLAVMMPRKGEQTNG